MYYIFMESLATARRYNKNLQSSTQKGKGGFPLLNFFLIISAFFVVAFLAYLVLNPEKKGADERNTHRSTDISSILTLVSNHIGEAGEIPESIPVNKECVATENEICKSGMDDCSGLVNLSFLDTFGEGTEEIAGLPVDPASKSVNGTGYYISQDGQGNVTVCAPYAERNAEISFTEFVF